MGKSGAPAVCFIWKRKTHQFTYSTVCQDYHVICVELSGEESFVYDLARCPPLSFPKSEPGAGCSSYGLSLENVACP